jgi:hypothetical protein
VGLDQSFLSLCLSFAQLLSQFHQQHAESILARASASAAPVVAHRRVFNQFSVASLNEKLHQPWMAGELGAQRPSPFTASQSARIGTFRDRPSLLASFGVGATRIFSWYSGADGNF